MSVTELYDTRVSRGEHGRLTIIRRFLVDLTLGTGVMQITPEYAPYVSTSSTGGPGVPQLGTVAEDLRDGTRMNLMPQAGFVPMTSQVWMVGFQTFTTASPYHVIVECEFDNFTLGKFRTLRVTASTEEWPFFQRHPYTAGASQTRKVWSLQTMKFPISRPTLQVRMKLKTLPTVLQAKLNSEAGKIHFFDSQYWMFEGATAVQQGLIGHVNDGDPIWDINYQWIGDPGFIAYNSTDNPDLFAPGALLDQSVTVIPKRFPLSVDRGSTIRFPFESYVTIPQNTPDDGTNAPASRPDLIIIRNANYNDNGWQDLPGNPLG